MLAAFPSGPTRPGVAEAAQQWHAGRFREAATRFDALLAQESAATAADDDLRASVLCAGLLRLNGAVALLPAVLDNKAERASVLEKLRTVVALLDNASWTASSVHALLLHQSAGYNAALVLLADSGNGGADAATETLLVALNRVLVFDCLAGGTPLDLAPVVGPVDSDVNIPLLVRNALTVAARMAASGESARASVADLTGLTVRLLAAAAMHRGRRRVVQLVLKELGNREPVTRTISCSWSVAPPDAHLTYLAAATLHLLTNQRGNSLALRTLDAALSKYRAFAPALLLRASVHYTGGSIAAARADLTYLETRTGYRPLEVLTRQALCDVRDGRLWTALHSLRRVLALHVSASAARAPPPLYLLANLAVVYRCADQRAPHVTLTHRLGLGATRALRQAALAASASPEAGATASQPFVIVEPQLAPLQLTPARALLLASTWLLTAVRAAAEQHQALHVSELSALAAQHLAVLADDEQCSAVRLPRSLFCSAPVPPPQPGADERGAVVLARRMQAYALLQARQYDAALAVCEHVLLCKPADVVAQFWLADAQAQLGQRDAALASFEAVLGELASYDDVGGGVQPAAVAVTLDRHGPAAKRVRPVERRPTASVAEVDKQLLSSVWRDELRAQCYNAMGMVLLGSARAQEAAAMFRLAVALRPAAAAYRHNLLALLLHAGRLDECASAWLQWRGEPAMAGRVHYQRLLQSAEAARAQHLLAPEGGCSRASVSLDVVVLSWLAR